jgi:DNA-binding transcriptional LysR family regulator
MAIGAIDIVALRYLVEVVDAGSFTKAALQLGLNPSTLSRRVTEVEDRLGLTLLERTRSGVRVTSGGCAVLLQIRRVLGELAVVFETARSNGLGHAGEIRLGLRMPLLTGPLLDLLIEWRKVNPGILLTLYEMSDHDIRRAIAERTLDAAVITRHALWSGATSAPIYREAITAALPIGHALTFYDCLSWDLLRSETLLTQGWNDSQTAREFFASLLGSGVSFASHAASKQSILGLVAAGYGITLATESQARISVPGITFRSIAESNAWIDVDLVWPPESEDAAVGVFTAFVRDWSALRRFQDRSSAS